MMNETAEQKEVRMFNIYKKDLEKLALDGCDNNTEILQAIASKIGKQELTEMVVNYDYHLEWAIKEILK